MIQVIGLTSKTKILESYKLQAADWKKIQKKLKAALLKAKSALFITDRTMDGMGYCSMVVSGNFTFRCEVSRLFFYTVEVGSL